MNSTMAPNRGLAIRAREVRKSYRRYGSLTEQALDVLGISKLLFWRRSAYQEFMALQSVSLDIRHGERVGIVGRNGAGKTTFLKLVTGNFVPTSGSIEMNGAVQALMHIGLGFHPEFTGYENIQSALLYNGLADDELDEAMREVIEFVELDDFLQQPIKTYSTGMIARLQFACATAIKPDILIVDEILGAGDAYFSVKSADRMQRFTDAGCTLVLVSHSMQQVIQFCDRVIWLDGGQVVDDGPARQVVTAYEAYMFELSHGASEARLAALRNRSRAGTIRGPVSEHLAAVPGANPPLPPVPGAAGQPEAVEPESITRPIPEWDRARLGALMSGAAPIGDYDEVADVYRWVKDGRLRIAGVAMRGPSGRRQNAFSIGSPLTVDILVEAQEDGAYECWFVVLVYGGDGKPLVRHVSDKQLFTMRKGGRWLATLRYETLLLGQGEYHASVAIYRSWDPDDRASARWYELLNRSIEFRAQAIGSYDPSLFHHPSSWTFREEGQLSR
jgi:lipopolysaccharide transport system ATP-binding protein